jgi:hypothetical protein
MLMNQETNFTTSSTDETAAASQQYRTANTLS